MTAEQFREQALSFNEVLEGAHMGHPDFRARGRIFATLGYPDNQWAMVKLPLDEQKLLVEQHPKIFSLAKGAWGLQGSTMVHLDSAKADLVAGALEIAWNQSAATTQKKISKTGGAKEVKISIKKV